MFNGLWAHVRTFPDLGHGFHPFATGIEKSVFRRFGASEVLRHDREASFMSDFFKEFNLLMGQRSRATLAFALNTCIDGTRKETPFFLVHGWDLKSTLEAMLPMAQQGARDQDPRRW